MPEKDNLNNEKLWIAFGDIHDEIDNFNRIPELEQASGIIISGDLTIEGGRERAARVMDIVRKKNLPVLAQIGNMDKGEIDSWLNENGCNLHATVHELTPEIAIFGIGGSTFTPMHTCSEFSENAYAAWLDAEWEKASKYPHSILVSHNPPKDTLCDKINDALHPGSVAVRAFLEKNQPDLCICGHIHEGKAVDNIGKTVVINPGTLANGGYVIIRYKNGQLKATSSQVV